jgi:hypothetical protein
MSLQFYFYSCGDRNNQSLLYKIRCYLEQYRVCSSVTLFKCGVDNIISAVQEAFSAPDQDLESDTCPKCEKLVKARRSKWLRLPNTTFAVCYTCYQAHMYHVRKKRQLERKKQLEYVICVGSDSSDEEMEEVEEVEEVEDEDDEEEDKF